MGNGLLGAGWAKSSRTTKLGELLSNVSYEVVPFRTTEDAVLSTVPRTIPLTVTVTEARGIEATLRLTESLARHGYHVAPHLAARQFVDRSQATDVISRLREAGVRSVFIIGGDAPRPMGPFPDAYSLLRHMEAVGNPFEETGIAGYPEGHTAMSQDEMDLALKQKAPLASYVITQICFDAAATSSWAGRIAALGVRLPVRVGLPGPVGRQKLVRIAAGIGLGQSARFLQKQQGLLWRFLVPGGYHPTRLAKQLAVASTRTSNNIRSLHIFTFNELARTETWRRDLLSLVSEADVQT